MNAFTLLRAMPLATLGLAVAAMAFPGCAEAKDLEPLEMGATVPGFTMTDQNGEEHRLQDYEGKIVVLDFSSQECPYSRAADPQLNELVKTWEGKNVVLLSIDSHAGTTPEQIAAYAKDKELTFTILKDEANAYADALGASRTPEFFVVDKEGKLAYHGAFDDGREPGDGKTHYLEDAVTALLAGETPDPATTKPIGCGISRAN